MMFHSVLITSCLEIMLAVMACGSTSAVPETSAPNIKATVEAKLAQERAIEATAEARVKEEKASHPVPIPPTDTPIPPTDTPIPPTDTPIPPTITPYPCVTCDIANLVWPSIRVFRPATGTPGDKIAVEGRGGFYWGSGLGWDESYRSFALYFNGRVAGSVGCHVNLCGGSFTVPDGTKPGTYDVGAEGGRSKTFEVVNPTPTPNASSQRTNGEEYYEAGDWVMAVGEFTNAIQANPNYSNAFR
jgi:hypothetical protein